ncbi:hypothetical protein WJX73_001303 [Symbiochloris irregularis]|uniref:FMR1-interacting protein 1 conserved domain-containing protein n=1 Tax=Symbiochloris irregularis TaxID=706552 RepID=A0AAW1NW80_9CHLO
MRGGREGRSGRAPGRGRQGRDGGRSRGRDRGGGRGWAPDAGPAIQPQPFFMMPPNGMMGQGQMVFLPGGPMPPGMGAFAAPQPYGQAYPNPQMNGQGRAGPWQRGGRGRGPPQGRGDGPRHPKPDKKQIKADKKLDAEINKIEAQPIRFKQLTPEERADAEMYREERRKNFPSEQNVTKKQAAAIERAARGESEPQTSGRVLQLHQILARQQEMGIAHLAGTLDMLEGGGSDSYGPAGRGRGGRGSFRGGRGGDRGGRQGRGGRGTRGRGPPQGRSAPGTWAAAPQDLQHSNKRAATGAQGMQDPNKRLKSDPAAANASEDGLNGLMGYADSDEDGDAAAPAGSSQAQALSSEAPQNAASATAANATAAQASGQQQNAQPGEEAGKAKGKARKRKDKTKKRGKGSKLTQFQPPQAPGPKPLTLLQKLLAKDIHTERSHLLQAFRFLVANDFLVNADHAPVIYPTEPPPLPAEFDCPRTEDLDLHMDEEGESSEEDEIELEAPLGPLQPSGIPA